MPMASCSNVKASYLIACDGGRSPVRKQLGIEMVGSELLLTLAGGRYRPG